MGTLLRLIIAIVIGAIVTAIFTGLAVFSHQVNVLLGILAGVAYFVSGHRF